MKMRFRRPTRIAKGFTRKRPFTSIDDVKGLSYGQKLVENVRPKEKVSAEFLGHGFDLLCGQAARNQGQVDGV